MEEYYSEGKCMYCKEMFSKKSISKHLGSHLSKMEKEGSSNKTSVYHIKVEADEMFLHLSVNGNCTFKALDKFLRDIWLECCGHLSAFRHKNAVLYMRKNATTLVKITGCR